MPLVNIDEVQRCLEEDAVAHLCAVRGDGDGRPAGARRVLRGAALHAAFAPWLPPRSLGSITGADPPSPVCVPVCAARTLTRHGSRYRCAKST